MVAFENLQAADFQAGVQRLMPRGRAWPLELSTLFAAVCGAIGDGLMALHASSVNLLITESDPSLCIALLTDFETDYGLPDAAAPASPSSAERHAVLMARIQSLGGASVGYLESVAAAMGFSVTITEYRPFYAGVAAIGVAPVVDDRWSDAWLMTVPSGGMPAWASDTSELAWWIGQIQPAHLVVMFSPLP